MKQIIFKDMDYFVLENEVFTTVSKLLNHLSDMNDERFEILISTKDEKKKFIKLQKYLEDNMPDFRVERNSKDLDYNVNQEAILIKIK